MKHMWSEEELQAFIEEQGGEGEKIYNHKLNITAGIGSFIESLNLEIINKSNTPLTYNDLATYFPSSYTAKYNCSGRSTKTSVIEGISTNPYAFFGNEEGVFYAQAIFANNIDVVPSDAIFTDTITKI